MKPKYLCVLHLGNVGIDHPIFDNIKIQEIALLTYVIIEIKQNRIAGVQQYMVHPELPEIRQIFFSEEYARDWPGKEMLTNTFECLRNAIEHFHYYFESTFNIEPSTRSLCFVTDGQTPIRHRLYPEAHSKKIILPPYYAFFHDLIKEYKARYKASPYETMSIKKILCTTGIAPYTGSEYCWKKVGDMVNLTQFLINAGGKFESPDTITFELVSKIYKSSDRVDDDCVVRILGIPRDCSEQDVADFFIGLNLAEGGIALCLSFRGRRNGKAFVRFKNREHCDVALRRHRHRFGNMNVDISKATGENFINAAGGDNEVANAFLSRGAKVIIRMTDLPLGFTAEDVLTFFARGKNPCKVMLGEEGVFFVKNSDGTASGTALVLFPREVDAGKVLGEGKSFVISAGIKLFRVTPPEAQQTIKHAKNFNLKQLTAT